MDDAYWTRFALFHFPYEPEIDTILRTSVGRTSLFCDLGANKGFWTSRAAPLFQKVISVEASAQTFSILKQNAKDLQNVRLHHAAIHNQTGEELTFVNTYLSHASARLLQDGTAGQADQTETVTTLKVDDLVPVGMPALIKMDVEGAEVSAIEGAARTLNDGSVLIYEDHGADHDCAPSAHFLSRPEMRLYSIEDGLKPVKSLDQIRQIKTDTYKGYNFLAAQKNSPLLGAIVEHFANHT
ncbi:FkbM family methyltransferase [Roseovarius sp. EL26]|uniref:FkbM family methyltransferase n=1 Tax=Roseovarius sp. EL26 TaxID=2126672 RepID=UPI0020B14DDE|nr:FkbM family methyltransferase [Roseovarius sp. EL26]